MRPPPRQNRPDLPILTTASCILCVIIFVAVNANPSLDAAAKWGFPLDGEILKGRYWGLVTSAFVHVNLLHLAFNLSWLWALGGALERTIGSWRWLLFVLTSAFVSSGLQFGLGGAGIGMSGVIYAMFGFAWATRRRFPEMAQLAHAANVRIFVGWGVLCIFLTYAHVMNIGNGAHFGGLLFGGAVGAIVAHPKYRVPAALGLVILTAGSIVPLYWNPLSSEWAAIQAEKALKRKDWSAAERFIHHYLDHGGEDQKWAWRKLLLLSAMEKDEAGMKEAADHLQQIDPKGLGSSGP